MDGNILIPETIVVLLCMGSTAGIYWEVGAPGINSAGIRIPMRCPSNRFWSLFSPESA